MNLSFEFRIRYCYVDLCFGRYGVSFVSLGAMNVCDFRASLTDFWIQLFLVLGFVSNASFSRSKGVWWVVVGLSFEYVDSQAVWSVYLTTYYKIPFLKGLLIDWWSYDVMLIFFWYYLLSVIFVLLWDFFDFGGGEEGSVGDEWITLWLVMHKGSVNAAVKLRSRLWQRK